MHPDLSPHLHTEECNKLVKALFQCRKDSPILKFFGKCNTPYDDMLACMKKERLQKRAVNAQKAKEKHAAVRDAIKTDDTDYEELLKQYRKEFKGSA